MASLRDIAQRAKVSTAAVSKVLNGREIRISPEKRNLVKQVADELGYLPNIAARALRNKNTRSVAIIVPSMKTLFYPEMLEHIEKTLFSTGIQTLICNSEDNPEREHQHISALLSRQVDALVVSPAIGGENAENLKNIADKITPVLLLDRYFIDNSLPYVTSDNAGGAKKIITQMASAGCDKLYYLGEAGRSSPLDERLRGVQLATKKLQIPIINKVFCDFNNPMEIIQQTIKLLADAKCHAGLFVESHRVASSVLMALIELNPDLRQNLIIGGFDDFYRCLDNRQAAINLPMLAQPPICAIQDSKKLGEAVAAYLTSTPSNRKNMNSVKVPPMIETWDGNNNVKL